MSRSDLNTRSLTIKADFFFILDAYYKALPADPEEKASPKFNIFFIFDRYNLYK